MMNAAFTAHEITVNGKTFPVEYSISPSGAIFAFVTVQENSQPVSLRIKIDPADPNHAAALAAAQQERNEACPAEPDAPTQQEQDEATEEPARDPKQARGPVPEKNFIGLEIKGNGWKIVFDGSYDRTRVIFKRKPSMKAREAVENAGFYWSPVMQSWNKKLTFKAWRAAQSLAMELKTICG